MVNNKGNGDEELEHIVNKESNIIVITGPTAAGKSKFFTKLVPKLNDCGLSARSIMRGTTRALRYGEIDGVEYKFYSNENFIKAIEKKEIIANYERGGDMYGVSGNLLEIANGETGVIVIRDLGGLFTLKNYLIHNKISNISMMLYSDIEDTMQRLVERLENSKNDEERHDINKQIGALREETSSFMSRRDEFRHILSNHNINNLHFEEVLTHLVNRSVETLKLERNPEYRNLNNSDFRETYIKSLVNKLVGVSLEDLLKNPKKASFKFDDELLKNYSSRSGKTLKNLKDIIPPVIDAVPCYGVLSIYIPQPEEKSKAPMKEIKVILSDLFEMSLGLPQYRYDLTDPVDSSPMSFTRMPDAYTNFYLSFSATYDPVSLSTRASPLHTLTIEGIINGENPKRVQVLEHDEAQKVWDRRKQIISNTRLPYTNY
ncbi:MAG: hypothetical protein KAU20_03355 [Nanoarchaeota archaeon]|nr:hypothetical protein [Nanoarchaeota archaeon]